MIKSIAILAVLTVLVSIVAGCSRDDSAKYSQYRAGSKSETAEKPTAKEPLANKPSNDKPTHKVEPKSTAIKQFSDPVVNEEQVEKSLSAGIGFLSLSFQQAAEVRNQETAATAGIGTPGSWLAFETAFVQNAELSTDPGVGKPMKAAIPLAKPREIKLLVKEKSFRSVGPEDAVRVTYDDINLLKVLNMEPIPLDAPKHFPQWLSDLDGKRIRIRGFMRASFREKGVKTFMLGKDNEVCCFPGRAKIYDLFQVKMREGVTTSYIQGRPFDVVGVFHIKPWIEDGKWYRIYYITDALVLE